MIDNYLLEELVTFAKYQTLASTAKHLLVTQPTVTRGMQKLEDDLGVKLFDRQPNKITLTETGKMAAIQAQKVIDQNNKFYDDVRKYEFNHSTIHIASVAPGPMILLNSLKKQLPTNTKLSDKLLDNTDISNQLINNDYSMIITNQEIMTEEIESRYIGTEKLSVNLDQFTYLANKNSVTFDELKGLSFVVLTDIGVWKNIVQTNIPNAKFLYQEQSDSFTEITKYSNFPYFSTDISGLDDHHPQDDDRIRIPISDDNAKVDFYVAYLINQKKRLLPTIELISKNW